MRWLIVDTLMKCAVLGGVCWSFLGWNVFGMLFVTDNHVSSAAVLSPPRELLLAHMFVGSLVGLFVRSLQCTSPVFVIFGKDVHCHKSMTLSTFERSRSKTALLKISYRCSLVMVWDIVGNLFDIRLPGVISACSMSFDKVLYGGMLSGCVCVCGL